MSLENVTLRSSVVSLLLGVMVTGCAALQPGISVNRAEWVGTPLPEAMSKRRELIYELLVGEMAGKVGDVDVATAHYRRAAELSDDPRIAARTARIATFSNNFETALEAAQRWVELEPESEEAQQVAGMLLVQAGQPKEAVEHLARVIELAGKERYEISFARLSLMFARESVSPAELEALDTLRYQFSDVSHAHRTYAELAYRAQQFPEAIGALNRALALDESDQSARILRNRVLVANGETDEALTDMRRMTEEYYDDAELVHSLARMLVQAKRYEQALVQYQKAMSMQPDNYDLVFSEALLQIELKRYPEALTSLTKLTESPQHADDAYYYLGRVEEERRNWEQSLNWYVKIEGGERYFESQSRVAMMLGELQRYDEAYTYLAKLRNQSDNEAVQIRLYLAENDLLRDAGSYQQGYDLMTEVLEAYPNNIDVLYARSMMADKLGDIDLLEADLSQIIELEPDNATALNALGYTLADHNVRLHEAKELIERALAIRPDDPAILDSIGWINYRIGNLSDALKYLNKAHGLLDDPEIAAHLAQVLWVKGDEGQAKAIIRRALQAAPNDIRLQKLLTQFTQ